MGKRRQDPVEANADGSADLYEISTWEPRSTLDRFAHWLYHIGIRTLRYLVIVAAIRFSSCRWRSRASAQSATSRRLRAMAILPPCRRSDSRPTSTTLT